MFCISLLEAAINKVEFYSVYPDTNSNKTERKYILWTTNETEINTNTCNGEQVIIDVVLLHIQ